MDVLSGGFIHFVLEKDAADAFDFRFQTFGGVERELLIFSIE